MNRTNKPPPHQGGYLHQPPYAQHASAFHQTYYHHPSHPLQRPPEFRSRSLPNAPSHPLPHSFTGPRLSHREISKNRVSSRNPNRPPSTAIPEYCGIVHTYVTPDLSGYHGAHGWVRHYYKLPPPKPLSLVERVKKLFGVDPQSDEPSRTSSRVQSLGSWKSGHLPRRTMPIRSRSADDSFYRASPNKIRLQSRGRSGSRRRKRSNSECSFHTTGRRVFFEDNPIILGPGPDKDYLYGSTRLPYDPRRGAGGIGRRERI